MATAQGSLKNSVCFGTLKHKRPFEVQMMDLAPMLIAFHQHESSKAVVTKQISRPVPLSSKNSFRQAAVERNFLAAVERNCFVLLDKIPLDWCFFVEEGWLSKGIS